MNDDLFETQVISRPKLDLKIIEEIGETAQE